MREEPIYGTASSVRRWILLEQPGPWGRDALRESRLPAAVAAELSATADRLGARIILIRRPGGVAPARRRCYVVRSDHARVEEFVLDAVTDVLDIDLASLDAHEPLGGRADSQALYLVCTNGRHDACCAEFGQPLARAMAGAVGDQAWECSHIGGDRFAGNLVCFPHGLYYGHVSAEDGPRVAQLYEQGHIDLSHYRGRSCHPFVVQSAEYFLRAEYGLRHVDDVHYVDRRAIADDAVRSTFVGPSATRFTVDVRVSRAAREQRLTCQATGAGHPPRYELLAISSAGPGSPSSDAASSLRASRPRK